VEECRQKDEVIGENSNVISLKGEALKEKEYLVSEIQQQLAAKEAEGRQKVESSREKNESLWRKDEALKEKEEEVRKKNATIQTQQAEIQQLRDQLAVSPQVS